MIRTTSALLLLAAVASLPVQTFAPVPDQRLAHDIYKEFIELQSGFTSDATTPVAESAAKYARAAGFPDSKMYMGDMEAGCGRHKIHYGDSGSARMTAV